MREELNGKKKRVNDPASDRRIEVMNEENIVENPREYTCDELICLTPLLKLQFIT